MNDPYMSVTSIVVFAIAVTGCILGIVLSTRKTETCDGCRHLTKVAGPCAFCRRYPRADMHEK